jgi:pSer/pThr/pTyr-binding forkhead associated (FHA) protein
MPPSSAQRRSGRTRTPASRQRTNATTANNDSPSSRPAKRRRVSSVGGPSVEARADEQQTAAAAAPAQGHRQKDAEAVVEPLEEESSSDDEPETDSKPSDRIIPFLKEANYRVVVADLYANKAFRDEVTAYAKIAGKTWTYYVTKPTINVGRAADNRGDVDTPDQEQAHIDLGPNKLVSRVHATILFDSDDEKWHAHVNGRNGIKLNNVLYKKGQDVPLVSGDVIMIADTEMVFVSPTEEDVVQPEYLARLEQTEIKTEEPASSSSMAHAHPAPVQYHEPTHISPYAPPDANGVQAPAPELRATTERQATPVKKIMQAPYLAQNHEAAVIRTPNPPQSAIFAEEKEQVDYSNEASKAIKPPMSYATLIGQAILATSDEKLSLNGIYEWIKKNFSYYRHIEPGWQNSIRHNLSLNPSFLRVERENHAPGKGGLWYIAPDKIDEHRQGGLKITSRGGARQQSSNPSSPAPKRSPKKATPPKQELKDLEVPAMNTIQPTRQGAQTPSRPPRSSALTNVETQQLPQLSDDASPLPARGGPYTSQQSGRSPPTLGSSALFDEAGGSYLTTPAPRRYEPHIAVPSTQKLPSQWLPQSSPAPFWKNIGSTPARPMLDTSPIKGNPLAPPLESSSPPPALTNGSPTRSRLTPDHRAYEARMNSHPPAPRFLPRAPSPPKDDDNDEDGPLDLMG